MVYTIKGYIKVFCCITFLCMLTGRFADGQTFFEYYEEGRQYMKTDSFTDAETSFKYALKYNSKDNHQTRTYGMRFMEYFPNRELGIIYYKKNNLDLAIDYLEKSMSDCPSDSARDYLLRISRVKYDRDLSVVDDQPPVIEVFSPPMINTKVFQPVPNRISQIAMVGRVTDPGGVTQVMVGDEEAPINKNGDFKATVGLQVGNNDIYIQATDLSGNSITKSYFIYRDDTTIRGISSLAEGAKFYALIIGVSEYQDPQITDLDGYPLQDAERLAQILTTFYTFDRDRTIVLKNPGRAAIQRAFDDLTRVITDRDNLLIFYAGHGHYDEDTELGYWLPSDAEKEYTTNWIYNDVLVANLRRIHSRHTLLISDACFSGSIFKTRSGIDDAPTAYQKKYELKSRKAITSGVLQTVPNKSTFFKYLAAYLEENRSKYLSASQLFQDIEIPVGNNSPNTPQFGVIGNVGDEGGDFIFMKK
jgi:tetratricopeptide (TPR) repeat protein